MKILQPGFVRGLAALALFGAAQLSHAAGGLTASTVQVDYYLDSTASAAFAGSSVTVGAGVEYDPYTVAAFDLSPSFTLGTIDFGDSSITVTFDAGSYMPCDSSFGCQYDGLRISNLTSGNGFGDYTVTLGAGLGLATFSQSNGALWLDFKDHTYNAGDYVRLDLTPTAVPEPTSLALMLAGGAVVAVRRRRRA